VRVAPGSRLVASNASGVWLPGRPALLVTPQVKIVRTPVASAIAAYPGADGSAWFLRVGRKGLGRLIRVASDGKTILSSSSLPPNPDYSEFAIDQGLAWLACSGCLHGWVQGYDISRPRAKVVTKRFRTAGGPTDITAGGGYVWLSALDANVVYRIG
jgi:hypothetical protein